MEELKKLLIDISFPDDEDEFDEDEFGNVELKHQTNEYDDGNSQCSRVYYFEKFDCYVEFTGWYSPYDGHELENYKFVRPVERMATFYEPLPEFKKLSYNEIKTILESPLFRKHSQDPENWLNREEIFTNVNQVPAKYPELKIEFERLGSFNLIDHNSGSEHSTECWSVYYFIEHDVYIKFDGYYSSYSDGELRSMKQVFPHEKTMIVYE